MGAFLKWCFSDFWRWLGLIILIGVIAHGTARIVLAAVGKTLS